MAHISGLISKNHFCVGKYSNNNTLNGIEALWTVPAGSRSPFVPLYGFVRHISGTPDTSLTINIGTNASTYNNICTIVTPTSASPNTIKFDQAANIVITPGTTISYKFVNSVNGIPTYFYEVYLAGMFLTAT